MDVSKYPRDKIGLLIKISRMEQGLERAELSARTGINLSQLFRIENGQSVLNNYEIDILFDELLIDKKHFSQKDSYLNMIFDQYVDNYIYGLKLDNEILMKQAYELESDYECSINYYKWVCLKYFDGVISRQNDDKFLSLESIIVKVKGGFSPIEQQLCGIFLSLRKSREYKYNEAISILNSCLNSNDNTSETVSISKSMKILMLMPSALAIFKSWSGFGLRIPYSYFFIVAEFMPDN